MAEYMELELGRDTVRIQIWKSSAYRKKLMTEIKISQYERREPRTEPEGVSTFQARKKKRGPQRGLRRSSQRDETTRRE